MRKWKACTLMLVGLMGLTGSLQAQTVVATEAAPAQTYVMPAQAGGQPVMMPAGQMYCPNGQCGCGACAQGCCPLVAKLRSWKPFGFLQKRKEPAWIMHTPAQHMHMAMTTTTTRKLDSHTLMRRQALRQIGQLDCRCWPEVEATLIAALRSDPSEVVRQEAAIMLSRASRCTQRTAEALTVVASGSDKDGVNGESSPLVRATAYEALRQVVAKMQTGTADAQEAADMPKLTAYYEQLGDKPVVQTVNEASQTLVYLARQHAQPRIMPVQLPAMQTAQGPMMQQQPVQLQRMQAQPVQAQAVPVQPVQMTSTPHQAVEMIQASQQQPPAVMERAPTQQPETGVPADQNSIHRSVSMSLPMSKPVVNPASHAQPQVEEHRQPSLPSMQPSMQPMLPASSAPSSSSRSSSHFVEPPPPVPGTQASAKPNVDQLLLVLKHSIHSQQREWAAENLARTDLSENREVVQTLLSAAGRDPSNEVRVRCIRSLVKMNVKSVPVVTALRAISGDANPQVEQEAKVALNHLGGSDDLPRLVTPDSGRTVPVNSAPRPGMFHQRGNARR